MIQETDRPFQSKSPQTLFLDAYPGLRRVALKLMSRDQLNQSLTATALVNETYLKLFRRGRFNHWADESHFIRSLVRIMRSVLVDRMRRHQALKRGGDLRRVAWDGLQAASPESRISLLDIDEGLQVLSKEYPTHAELLQLIHFGDLSLAEAAQVLGIAESTAAKYHLFARARLYRWLLDQNDS